MSCPDHLQVHDKSTFDLFFAQFALQLKQKFESHIYKNVHIAFYHRSAHTESPKTQMSWVQSCAPSLFGLNPVSQ